MTKTGPHLRPRRYLLDIFQHLMEHPIEVSDILLGQVDASGHLCRDMKRSILHVFAQLRDGNNQIALVLVGAAAGDQSLFLQFLQQGSQGTGVQIKLLAQRFDSHGLVLPQNHHRNILGVGKTQLVEPGLVELDHLTGAGIEGEAELFAQLQTFIFFFQHIRNGTPPVQQ